MTWKAISCVIGTNNYDVTSRHLEIAARICILEKGEVHSITYDIFNS